MPFTIQTKDKEITLESLILYGDKAEMTMTQYTTEFIDAWIKLQSAQTGMSQEDTRVAGKIAAEYQQLQDRNQEINDSLDSLTEEEKVKALEEQKELINRLSKLSIEMVSKQELVDLAFGFSEEQKQKIFDAEKTLLNARNELLKLICSALMGPDRSTPVLDFESDVKLLPRGVKERLIFEVVKEPDNSISTAFLTRMRQLNPNLQ